MLWVLARFVGDGSVSFGPFPEFPQPFSFALSPTPLPSPSHPDEFLRLSLGLPDLVFDCEFTFLASVLSSWLGSGISIVATWQSSEPWLESSAGLGPKLLFSDSLLLFSSPVLLISFCWADPPFRMYSGKSRCNTIAMETSIPRRRPSHESTTCRNSAKQYRGSTLSTCSGNLRPTKKQDSCFASGSLFPNPRHLPLASYLRSKNLADGSTCSL
mmetsp:Transcript_16815/g.38708  ORF Transcript_16815/g.38708 Transcript_16815/m.38708 type:complete len:214 (-) Transcript_16815:996-1637(-)